MNHEQRIANISHWWGYCCWWQMNGHLPGACAFIVYGKHWMV